MANLMIRNNPALFLAQDAVFLFFANQNQLNCLKSILLGNGFPAILNGCDRRLVHHIG